MNAPPKPDPELDNAPDDWRAWWLFRGRLVTLPDGSLDLAPDATCTRHRRREPSPASPRKR